MHIPSEDIYREMLHEAVGIWFVSSIGTDTHAILLKAPTNVLKAVMSGCEVNLTFAVNRAENTFILVSCIQIYDDKAAPVMISSPHINQIGHDALPEILNRESTPLFLYDELDRNIAWSESSWSESPGKIFQLVKSFQDLYVGECNEDVQYALDNLQISLDSAITIPSAIPIEFEQIGLVCRSFNAMNIYSYSVNDNHQMFNALDENEGDGFEQSTWQLLESLFDYQLYRSPQAISSNGKQRELTDVFGFNDKGVFLFEAKVSSVLTSSPERSTERRARNLENQIKKALGQINGGIRAIRNKQKILSRTGAELDFSRNIVPHGIVVVSEMLPAANWTEILLSLMEAALESSSMLHIIDLRELRNLISHSSSVYQFDYYLMQRFEAVVNKEDAFIRTRFIR